jgi:hypothetical protein
MEIFVDTPNRMCAKFDNIKDHVIKHLLIIIIIIIIIIVVIIIIIINLSVFELQCIMRVD